MAGPWEKYAAPTEDEGPWSKYQAAPDATAEPKPSLYQRMKNAVYVPPDQREDKTFGEAVQRGISGVPEEIGKQFGQSVNALSQDVSRLNPFREQTAEDQAKELSQGTSKTFLGPAGDIAADVAGAAFSPISGALTSVIGRPVEEATGLRREITGGAASIVAPFGGLAKGAQIASKAGRIFPTGKIVAGLPEAEASRAASVDRLKQRGVELSRGQETGKGSGAVETDLASDPYFGRGIIEQQDDGLRSFQRGAYNEVLAPIGETYKDKAIGNTGVKRTGDIVSKAYDDALSQASLDGNVVVDKLAEVRIKAQTLPPPLEKRFEDLLNNQIIDRFQGQGPLEDVVSSDARKQQRAAGAQAEAENIDLGMNPTARTATPRISDSISGQDFKAIESNLLSEARDAAKGDEASRAYASRIQDLVTALREGLEETKSNPPELRERLKNINTSWALLTRLERAAGSHATAGGQFSPGDLAQAVKMETGGARRRAFSRGDALMQDYAQAALDILPNRRPGTVSTPRPRDIASYAVSHVTNPAARAYSARSGPPSIRSLAPIPRANALQRLSGGSDEQQ